MRELVIKIKADSAEAKTELAVVDKAVDKIGKTSTETDKKVSAVTGNMSKAFVALGAAIAAVDIGRKFDAIIQKTSQLQDAIQRIGGGVTAEAFQRLAFAAEQSGSSMATLNTALAQMANHLTDGDKGAVHALQDLNLSLDELRRLSPDQAFIAIGDAIARTEDPLIAMNAGMAIFGRGAGELLPAFRNGLKEVGDQAPIMSNAIVKAGDEAGDKLNQMKGRMQVLEAEALTPLMKAFTSLPDSVQVAMVGIGQFMPSLTGIAVAILAAGGPKAALTGIATLLSTTIPLAARTAMGALATFAWPVALTAAGALGIWEVGKAFVNLFNVIRSGGSVWEFLTAKDDDNFVRRWLGLSSGVKEAGVQFKKTGEEIKLMSSHQNDANKGIVWGTGIIDDNTEANKRNAEAAKEAAAKKKELAIFTKELAGNLAVLNIVQGETNVLFQEAEPAAVGYLKQLQFIQDEIRDLNNMKVEPLFQEPIAELGDYFKKLEEAGRRMKEFTNGIKRELQNIQDSVADNFAEMIMGGQSFRDAMLGIWGSIKQGITRILSDILNQFITSFLGGMLSGLKSKAGELGAAFAGIFKMPSSNSFLPGESGGMPGGGGIGGAIGGALPWVSAIAAGAALIGPISSALQGGEEGKVVNPARDQFFLGYGPSGTGPGSGFFELAAKLAAAGKSYLFDELVGAKKLDQFTNVAGLIKALPGFLYGSNGIQDFGRGTLAVLHGREEVRTEAQVRSQSGGVTIQGGINITVSGAGKNAAQLARELGPELMKQLGRFNVGGARRQLQVIAGTA